MALKLIHTADWHLGRVFHAFRDADRVTLQRARLEVIDRILGVAQRIGANAVLCAGDLFDSPDPSEDWWKPLATKLAATPPSRPIFLLPGNHDPLTASSVYSAGHAFRRMLPAWVHVVDRDLFTYELGPDAMLYAAPCKSQAGQKDLAMSLPAREPGDERIRIGLVHGSTFDMKDYQANFPIAVDAARSRGLDYLAIGDTHSFRFVPAEVEPYTVYPSAPEPTTFGEADAGYVAVVLVTRKRRVRVEKERVAAWTWEAHECRTLLDLRALRERDLIRHVVRLTVQMQLAPAEYAEAERILRELEGTESTYGRAGILQLDRTGLRLDTSNIEDVVADLPDVLQAAARRLKEHERGPDAEVARRALFQLLQLAPRR